MVCLIYDSFNGRTFICLPVNSAYSLMTAVMTRERSWTLKSTDISSKQQLTIRRKGLCLGRRIRRRRQNGTDRERAGKLRTSSLLIKVEIFYGGLRWIYRGRRIEDWWWSRRRSWKRGVHLWCNFISSYNGKKHNALSFKYLALKSSFSSRHLLSLTGNSLPSTPWFGITFKLQAIYGVILS